MRFRRTLTFLIMAAGLVFALPALARQKGVGPSSAGPRPNAVRPYVALAAALAPPGAQGGFVAPTLRSAFCSGGVPTAGRRSETAATMANAFACAAMLPALPAGAQQNPRPFTQDQVRAMMRDGFGDESGAKLIEQRGIDFAPSEDFIQTLKAAGASEAFLMALRAAVAPGLSPAQKRATGVPPVPEHGRDGHGTPTSADLKVSATTAASEAASAKKPLNQVQVFALLAGQVPSHRVTMLVQERGIDFDPTDDYLQEVRLAGGEDELISALKSAKVTKPVTVDPVAQACQAEIRRHVARGAELKHKRQYAEAEKEYRAALILDSQNGDLYASLSSILDHEEKWDDAVSAGREALRLNPENEKARVNLGSALGEKGDLDGAIREFREALRMDPNDADAHYNLGIALGNKGDSDGEIAEYLAALRLNPNYAEAHVSLGSALLSKGDWDGAIVECREALRLKPNDAEAHINLGIALGAKGDWDGEIAVEREALRMNPKLAEAHKRLGLALELKGDGRGALEEYRAAYMLDPKNADYKQDYERLLQQVNQ